MARYDYGAIVRSLIPPIFGMIKARWRDRNRRDINLADADLYRPVFSPWMGGGDFGSLRDEISRRTLVSSDRQWVLYSLARQCANLSGDFVECGVYRGGTAKLLARVIDAYGGKGCLHLFDTFEGMPATDQTLDKHDAGDFSDTSLHDVQEFVGAAPFVIWHKGRIPETFDGSGIENVTLLHVDLDIRQSVFDALEALYDKLVAGGIIVFDDYGFHSCYGARVAVDNFFSVRPEVPLCLPTGQAVVIKLPRSE